MTRVLLVGGGAREHAMAEAIVRSKDSSLFAVAKHRNPGIARIAQSYHSMDECDIAAVVEVARRESVDVVVVGPEAPEEAGLVDALIDAGFACASPTRAAARIETDKQFMRELMERHSIAGRLAHHPFDDAEAACQFLDENGPVWAIKPIGLTGGKGVQVYGDHFQDVEGAKQYARSVFASGAGGGHLQFEELAVGEEFTLMGITDGETLLPMVCCQDHKRLYEGDTGPNTGGMGSYSDANGLLPFLTQEDRDGALAILQAIIDALHDDGCPYVGAIYGQFMLTRSGPKVIEVNARFGDPEAMNVLHLLETDYVQLLQAMATGSLSNHQLSFRPNATVVKYMVPRGYGDGKPEAGAKITVDDEKLTASGAAIYFASIQETGDGELETLTSRTLGVIGEAATISDAEKIAEAGLACVNGNLVVRHDIGTPELIQKRIDHVARMRAEVTA